MAVATLMRGGFCRLRSLSHIDIFSIMNLTMLRHLIREMILIEKTQPAAPTAAAPATSTSANIPSYHTENLPKAQAYAKSLVAPLAPVGGYVIQVAGGKVTFASGTILPRGALKAAGATPEVLEKFALTLDQNLRSSIKKGHWAISNPAQWTKNVLDWKDKEGKQLLATTGAAKNLQDYLISEMDAMPITITIADPAIGTKKRGEAFPDLAAGTYAFYETEAATYVFNLVSDTGWKTIKPLTITYPHNKVASDRAVAMIAGSLKEMLANPVGVEHVPRHEFGHADENLITYFLQQVIARRVGKGMTAAASEVTVTDVDSDAVTQARLGNFKSAVKRHSADLINAQYGGQVAQSIVERHPELGNAKTAFQHPAYLYYLTAYAGVLTSLGLVQYTNHPLAAFGVARPAPGRNVTVIESSMVMANEKSAKVFNVNAAGPDFMHQSVKVTGESPQAIVDTVKAYSDEGGAWPWDPGHILDTLKMLQQNLEPGDTDLDAAINKLASDPVAGEEARRARVLADLAGPDFFSAVQTVAAADELPQNSSSA